MQTAGTTPAKPLPPHLLPFCPSAVPRPFLGYPRPCLDSSPHCPWNPQMHTQLSPHSPCLPCSSGQRASDLGPLSGPPDPHRPPPHPRPSSPFGCSKVKQSPAVPVVSSWKLCTESHHHHHLTVLNLLSGAKTKSSEVPKTLTHSATHLVGSHGSRLSWPLYSRSLLLRELTLLLEHRRERRWEILTVFLPSPGLACVLGELSLQ